MHYLIGTDEAGYGPNLGPLVIAATVWRVPRVRRCDLFRLLADAVVQCQADATDRQSIAIADSKQLYKSGDGLAALERGVLASLGVLGCVPSSARLLWQWLDAASVDSWDDLPWHLDRDLPLPVATCPVEQTELVPCIAAKLRKLGVELVGVRACAVFPARFNQLTDELNSKGEALSRLTLELLGSAIELCGDGPIHIVCDKHGGRGRYHRLLQQQFPDPLIEVIREGMQQSVYRWGPSERRVEVCFQAKGESFLPAALASMFAKYLRELSMHSFNAFWQEHVANLRPTAGYPLDAKRFKSEIAVAQSQLGIADDVLWRRR